MRLRLSPRDTSFYHRFSAAAGVAKGALLLEQLLTAPATPGLVEEIRAVESEGDHLAREVLTHLASTFVTPFDREDIYRLVQLLDDALDHIEKAADLVSLYEVSDLPIELVEASRVLRTTAEVTAEGIDGLEHGKGVAEHWARVDELEHQADVLYRLTLKRLFSGEYDALTALKLKELAEAVEAVEAAVDALEDVSDTVETITIKES